MTIFALLRGHDNKGRVTFHGLTDSADAADAWRNSGKGRWTSTYEDENGRIHLVSSEPITKSPLHLI